MQPDINIYRINERRENIVCSNYFIKSGTDRVSILIFSSPNNYRCQLRYFDKRDFWDDLEIGYIGG